MATEKVNWVNDNHGETEPIIVTLDGAGDTSVAFEQAFGEFSEARGRRRARRQARRLERIKRRQERRRLRRQGRMEAMQERQAIKSERRRLRKARKEIGNEEEDSTDTPSESTDTNAESTDTASETSYAAPTEDTGENDSVDEEQAVDSESGPSDEESGFTGDYGADGERSMSQYDAEFENFYSSAEGQSRIHKGAIELSRRIEKNKEIIKRIEGRIFITSQKNGGVPSRSDAGILKELNRKLEARKALLAELEAKLAGYTKFEGDFSSAEGPQWRENARRRAEVRAAKRIARHERKQAIRANRQERIKQLIGEKKGTMPLWKARIEARKQARLENPFKATSVQGSLEPSFSPNKIEVPAQDGGQASSFNGGTGLIGVDNMHDIDAPAIRNVDLHFSNADGSSKINWKYIAIGVGVAVVGIIVYKKYFKKK